MASAHFISAFQGFIEETSTKINSLQHELKEAKTALQHQVNETQRNNEDLHIRVEGLTAAQDGVVKRTVPEVTAGLGSCKEAVDEILQQHNSLAARVQGLERVKPTTKLLTAKYGLTAASDSDNEHTPDEIPAFSPCARIGPSSGDSYATAGKDLEAGESVYVRKGCTSNAMLPPPRPQPSLPPFLRGAPQSIFNSGSPSGFLREASVASTMTMRGDESPVKGFPMPRPPPRAANPAVRPAPQRKRKLPTDDVTESRTRIVTLTSSGDKWQELLTASIATNNPADLVRSTSKQYNVNSAAEQAIATAVRAYDTTTYGSSKEEQHQEGEVEDELPPPASSICSNIIVRPRSARGAPLQDLLASTNTTIDPGPPLDHEQPPSRQIRETLNNLHDRFRIGSGKQAKGNASLSSTSVGAIATVEGGEESPIKFKQGRRKSGRAVKKSQKVLEGGYFEEEDGRQRQI